MDERPRLWRRIALQYETARRPRLILAVIVAAIYVPALFLPLMVDDYRALRQFRAFRAGQIDRLDLFAFAREPEQIRRERDAGYFPWWISEDLRFRYFRPVAEASLYLDFLMFGEHSAGYRVVSGCWYVVGVWLVLAFFRRLGRERIARWGALIFAVAGCHAIPVVFASARCDLISIVFVMAAMVMLADFLMRGGGGRFAAAIGAFLVSLGSKEASVAACVMPAVLYWVFAKRESDATGLRRRAVSATAAFLAVGVGFLAFAAAMKSGSNALIILDPLRARHDYLTRAPLRMVSMLSAWALQFNPMVFCQRERYAIYMQLFAAAGGLALLAAFVGIFVHRRDRALMAMTFWSLVFLPILACTPPEDRVIGLPSIGLAYLSAYWLTSRRDGRLYWLPAWLFIAVPIFYTEVTLTYLMVLEGKEKRQLQVGVDAFGRPPRESDWIIFKNAPQLLDVLWTQDRLDALTGGRRLNVAVLHDADAADVTAVDGRTIRIRATGDAFLSSFAGLVGRSRTAAARQGDRVQLPEYCVTLSEVENGRIKELLVEFAKPLDSDSYRFLELERFVGANVVSPPAIATRPANE